MSRLRVALVSEGPTDAVVIQAALKALLPRPFVLTVLQPDPILPRLGGGWGGVLRWCCQFAGRGADNFEGDPTLHGFDLFIVHVDADVTDSSYGAINSEMADLARGCSWPVLPQAFSCPPAAAGANFMRSCLLSWSSLVAPGPKTVLCVPSKAIESWVAAAMLADGHPTLQGLECNPNVEGKLKILPVGQRIRKSLRNYRACEAEITRAWDKVRLHCIQAEQFSADVRGIAGPA